MRRTRLMPRVTLDGLISICSLKRAGTISMRKHKPSQVCQSPRLRRMRRSHNLTAPLMPPSQLIARTKASESKRPRLPQQLLSPTGKSTRRMPSPWGCSTPWYFLLLALFLEYASSFQVRISLQYINGESIVDCDSKISGSNGGPMRFRSHLTDPTHFGWACTACSRHCPC